MWLRDNIEKDLNLPHLVIQPVCHMDLSEDLSILVDISADQRIDVVILALIWMNRDDLCKVVLFTT